MRKLTLAIMVLTGILSASIFEKPDFTKVGTSGATFLKINTSARVQGLGGAFTAVADDIAALSINPAGLTNLKKMHLAFNYTKWVSDVKYNYLAFGMPVRFGAIGIQVGYLTMGEMEETTLLEPDGTGFTFDASSAFVGVTYGRSMTDKLSVGITAKVIREAIKRNSAVGYAIDLGTYYRTGFKSLRIAMAVLNFGTKMSFKGPDLDISYVPSEWKDRYNFAGTALPSTFKTTPYKLPLVFRMGIAYDLVNNVRHRLTTALDVLHPNDGQEKVLFGVEYTFNRIFSLRAGYKLDPDRLWDEDEDYTTGLSAGTGFRFRIGKALVNIDYAYYNNGLLGNNHFVTVGYSF